MDKLIQHRLETNDKLKDKHTTHQQSTIIATFILITGKFPLHYAFINFMFYPLCLKHIYSSRMHTLKVMKRGEGSSVKWFKTKRRMSRVSYETHVKYCSSQALLSSGTVLKSAHNLFNIRQLHII